MANFQENLQELIAEKGLSLRKIGEDSEFTSGQLSEYLHGAYPTVEKGIKLAEYFDCSLDYLFGLTENRNYSKYNKKPFDLNLFIARYQDLLKINNITHWKFSKRVGLAESTLRHWQAGHKPITDRLYLIAITLNGSIDYLVGRIDKF